jgi:hypothetical protein
MRGSSREPGVAGLGDAVAQDLHGDIHLRGCLDLHEHRGRIAVDRGDRRRHTVGCDALDAPERLRVIRDRLGVGVRQSTVTGVDDDRRDDVGGAELRLRVLHPCRFRVLGQELGKRVLGHLAEPAERRPARSECDEPDEDEGGRDEHSQPRGDSGRAGAASG